MAQKNNVDIIGNLKQKLLKDQKGISISQDILEYLISNSKKQEQITQNENLTLEKQIKNASINYLTSIETFVSRIQAQTDIANHQQSIQQRFVDSLEKLYQTKQKLEIQQEIKIIYALTIKFQEIINQALSQEMLTIFVVEGEKNIPYLFSIKLDDFLLATDLALDKTTGNIKFNLTMQEINSIKNKVLINTTQSQSTKRNIDLAKHFGEALAQIKKVYTTPSKGANKYDKFLSQQGLNTTFFTTRGDKRKYILVGSPQYYQLLSALKIENTKEFLSQFQGYFKKIYGKDKYIKLEDFFKLTEEYSRQKNLKLITRLKKINVARKRMSEKASYYFQFSVDDNTTVRVGQRGDLREAFFGAFYNINNLQLSDETELYMKYLSQVDNESGLFKGDYSVLTDETNKEKNAAFFSDFKSLLKNSDAKSIEIQIKSGNASFNVPQFIGLAEKLSTIEESKIFDFLSSEKSSRAQGIGKGRSKEIKSSIEKIKDKAIDSI